MRQQINLLNPQLIRHKDRLSANVMLKMAVVVVVLMGIFAAWSSYRMRQLTAEQQQVAAQLATLKVRLNATMQQHAKRPPNPALVKLVETTGDALTAHLNLLDFLEGSGFGRTQGFSGFMQAFARQNTQGLWLTGFVIDEGERQIQISGRSLQPELVPQYIALLGQEPLLQGREFSALSMAASIPQPPADPKAAAKAIPVPPPYVEFRLQSVDPKAVVGQEKKS